MASLHRSAPVFARLEDQVNADIETVWRFISDIENWPDWSPNIGNARVNGDLAPGTRCDWKSGPVNIDATLQRVEPPSAIAWTGAVMGIRAYHVWTFQQGGSHTAAVTEESWDGLLPKLLRWPLRRFLQNSLRRQMKYLKARAELEAGNYEPPVP